MNYIAMPGLKRLNYAERLTPDKIQEEVLTICMDHFGLTFDELSKRNRDRERVYARQVTMYFLKQCTKLTKKSIGQIFGMDHTTVIHSLRQLKNLIDTEDKVKKEIWDLSDVFAVLGISQT